MYIRTGNIGPISDISHVQGILATCRAVPRASLSQACGRACPKSGLVPSMWKGLSQEVGGVFECGGLATEK